MGTTETSPTKPGTPQRSFLPSIEVKSKTAAISSAVAPYLKRLDIWDDFPARHQQKSPLITLKLSSTSFLNSVVNESHIRGPLYTIDTVGAVTAVTRRDPWEGSCRTADIRWPKHTSPRGGGKSDWDGVLLQMDDGRWKAAEHLLKSTGVVNTWKFNMPPFSHTLKWKLVGTSYQCTCSSIKGLVAALEPAVASVPPRLKIFENIHDKHDTRPSLEHHGIPVLLIDYLLVTSLLLVTHMHEWMTITPTSRRRKHGDEGRFSVPNATGASIQQWRKIVYGEPLFPKMSLASSEHLSTPSPTPDQWAKVIHGDPLFPTSRRLRSRPSLPDLSGAAVSTDSEEEGEEQQVKAMPLRITTQFAPWRPSSSPAGAMTSSKAPNSALPSHTPYDPEVDASTLRPIPIRYQPSTCSLASGPDSSLGSRQGGMTPIASEPMSRIPSTLDSPMVSSKSENDRRSGLSHATSLPSLSTPSTTRRRRKQPQRPRTNPSHVSPPSPSPFQHRSLPDPPASSTASTTTTTNAFEQFRLRSTEKFVETEDVSDWVQSLTQVPDLPGAISRSALHDQPPPAYNSINFSLPHASVSHHG